MWNRVFFVCTNAREGRAACANRGSERLYKEMKRHLKTHPELKPGVRVTTSGCLDLCDHGPVIAVFPEATVYLGVTADDLPDMFEHVETGRRAEALTDSPKRRRAVEAEWAHEKTK